MKKALIVGINYVGTSSELRGCVNDAHTVNSLLQSNFGFAAHDVKMLLDAAATTNNMLAELNKLVDGAVAGDTLYFHYSGHGSQMVDKNADEADGLDEILCPVDLNWRDKVIRDDDLKIIFNKVPAGVNLTVSLDCCNSGSGLDQTNQYQPITDKTVQSEVLAEGRYMPPPAFAVEGVEFSKIAYKNRMVQSRDVNRTGLLLSGCQSHQTSADAYIGGKYQGAFTYALAKVLADNAYKIQYVSLIEEINKFMVAVGFTQRPELNGSPSLFGANFLEEQEAVSSGLLEPVTVQPVVDEPEEEKSNNKLLIGAGILIAVAAAIYFLA